ncbi:MAG: hypothetical protein AAGF60_05630 [Pseudomonadota bacterium]
MSKPSAIIHVGFNKCGSTAIQAWLSEQRMALTAQGIVHLHTDPRTDVICSNPQMATVAHALGGTAPPDRPMNAVLGTQDRAGQDRVARDFQAQIAARAQSGDMGTFLASCEYLSFAGMTERDMAGLHGWLSSLFQRVRYVVYIRQPEPWLVSLHGHAARLGASSETLDQFAARMPRVPFAEILKRWVRAVGAEALRVRLFYEAWLSGDGLIPDFARTIGASDAAGPAERALYNTSFAPQRAGGPQVRESGTAPRPRLGAEARARVRAVNGPGLAWIGDTFFAANRGWFDRWAEGPA